MLFAVEILINSGTMTKYLSLGAGLQSSTLLHMSMRGDFEKPDVVIFANTQCEPQYVYDNYNYLKNLYSGQIEFIECTKSNLLEVCLKEKRIHIPAYKVGRTIGILQRQCTTDWKIKIINRTVRIKLGIFRKRIKQPMVEKWIGFSDDESNRRVLSKDVWQVNKFPLIELHMTKNDCINYLQRNNLSIPGKSSCIICPFHSNTYWRELKIKYPDEFEKACQFDDKLRDLRAHNRITAYLHGSRRPLRDIDFTDNQLPIQFGVNENRECLGVCFT